VTAAGLHHRAQPAAASRRSATARLASRVAIFALLGLQGCSVLQPRPAAPGWTQGRLLVRVDASGSQPAQSASAEFELRGSGTSGELRLNSPLGTRMATATWAPGRVRLATLDGERSFQSLDELSRQALGQAVPLAALPDWLAGRPWSEAAHQPNASGFEQMGWQVNTAQRAQGLIEARRAAAPAVLLRVRLDAPA
jgi:outer membrane lipoprotein LolB